MLMSVPLRGLEASIIFYLFRRLRLNGNYLLLIPFSERLKSKSSKHIK